MPDTYGITPHNPLEGDQPEFTLDLSSGDGSDDQIAIVVVHKDRPEYLNLTLQSIAVNSTNKNYEIIVVDNGSGKATQDYLDDIEKEVNIKVVRNDRNLYWSAAANKGAERVGRNVKYIVFMHCDVVVLHPGWLDTLIHVVETQKSGLVGVDMNAYFIEGNRSEFIQEWLMIMTKEAYDHIGPWPEKLPMLGHAFAMSLRANASGFRPQVIKNTIAHHYRIMSLDVSEYERMTEQMMATMPEIWRDAQFWKKRSG